MVILSLCIYTACFSFFLCQIIAPHRLSPIPFLLSRYLEGLFFEGFSMSSFPAALLLLYCESVITNIFLFFIWLPHVYPCLCPLTTYSHNFRHLFEKGFFKKVFIYIYIYTYIYIDKYENFSKL